MKLKTTLTIFALLTISFLLINNAAGPGFVQDEDRTGSPLSSGACDTDGCHVDGAFDPSVSIELLKDNMAVDKYQPGESYSMKVTITASQGLPSAYGFQAVALSGSNENTGAWGAIPAGMQELTLANNRTYVEHSVPNSVTNFFECEWTAPQAGTGDVTFYAAGNAVDLSNDETGDGAMATALTLTEEEPDGVKSAQQLLTFTIFPNPVVEILNFKIGSRHSGIFDLQITDTQGKIVQMERLVLIEGQNEKNINVSNLPNGLYLIHLAGEKESATQTMLKM